MIRLAHLRARERVHADDIFRFVPLGKLVHDVPLQFLYLLIGELRRHKQRDKRLVVLSHLYGGALPDKGEFHRCTLYLGGEHVDPRDLDEPLFPAHEIQRTVGKSTEHIPRLQPAHAVLFDECRTCRRLVVEIARHKLVARKQQFPRLARGDVFPLFVHYAAAHIDKGFAQHRSPRFLGREDAHAARLRQPVAGREHAIRARLAHPRVEAVLELGIHGVAAHIDAVQRPHVLAAEPGFCEQFVDHAGHRDHQRDAVFCYGAHRLVRLEHGHEHGRRRDADDSVQPDEKPEAVEHRESCQHPVLFAVALLFEDGEQIARERVDGSSREHHRLGVAGRPSGAHIHRRFCPVPAVRLEGLRPRQTYIAVGEEGAHHPLHSREPFAQTLEIDIGKKNRLGVLLAHGALELPSRHQRMDHGSHGTDAGHGVKCHNTLLYGGQREHDDVASAHSERGESARDSLHLFEELGESHLFAASDESRPLPFFGAVGAHIIVKRHLLRYHTQIIIRTHARSQYANPSSRWIK